MIPRENGHSARHGAGVVKNRGTGCASPKGLSCFISPSPNYLFGSTFNVRHLYSSFALQFPVHVSQFCSLYSINSLNSPPLQIATKLHPKLHPEIIVLSLYFIMYYFVYFLPFVAIYCILSLLKTHQIATFSSYFRCFCIIY